MNALISRILASIRDHGYHYEPAFSSDIDGERLVELARRLGTVFTGPGLDHDLPVLVTRPAADAEAWRPFDRPEGIGWHNDFSTLPYGPVLSLAWIVRPDPEPERGAWRAASCTAVLRRLTQTPEGSPSRLLGNRAPFGYRDAGVPSLFPLVAPAPDLAGREGLRFYGRALREGALVHLGHVPLETERLIEEIEQAADEVGQTLDAARHALLVCHNRLALHDRTPQTVSSARPLRESILCFVSTLHSPGLLAG